ncbi:putative membrane-anchored protein [Nocardia sp. GAS34]|uniref:COG4705 family protein n=1 Tax=unclassified Nocardia TaxID=2637762 RepID=UPI003D1D9A2B
MNSASGSPNSSSSALTRIGALRVPEVAAAFWIIKGLSTAMGESTSDLLVTTIDPQIAVVLGFVAFLAALILQLRLGRYNAWAYWLAVVMVGVFGTMAADVMHVVLGVPYPVSTLFYAVVLVAVFFLWYRTERTLSIHEVNTTRRELFYWAAVMATFAMGTALGDFTAYTLHWGYAASAAVFTAGILVPAAGYRWLGWNPILCFWGAYVITRPLGASVADWLGKPADTSGLGLGDGPVVAVLGLAILALVAYLAVTKSDVQRPGADDAPDRADTALRR